MPYDMQYCIGQLGSALLAVSPPSILCTLSIYAPSHTTDKKGFGSVPALLRNNKNSSMFSAQIKNSAPYCEENELHPIQNQHTQSGKFTRDAAAPSD